MKRFVQFLALFIIIEQAAILNAQIPAFPYPNFTPGAIIASAEVNANFSLAADYALKRNGGGIIEGPLTVNAGVTIDGADLSTFLIATGEVRSQVVGVAGTPAFAPTGDATTGLFFAAGKLGHALSGVERMGLDGSGLTIFGNNILNASGKIPAITSVYFGNLQAQGLQLAETSFTDGTSLARNAADEAITGSYLFSNALALKATWNNAAITFKGMDVQITNTLSAAASRIFDVKLASVSKFSVDTAGKAIAPALKITGGAANLYFLVGDANGTGFWTPSATASPVPSGMLAYFEAACPAGWTIRSDATNIYDSKFLRGGATFATGSLGSDTHTHAIDPPNTTSTTESVGHTHTVDLASGTSNVVGAHEHSYSATTSSDGGSHTHTFSTGAASGSFGTSPSTPDDVAVPASHTHSGTTNSTSVNHTHSVGSGSTFTSRTGDHTHDVDYPLTTSSGVSATHTHDLDIASFTSGSGSNVPAYVQVIVCRKD